MLFNLKQKETLVAVILISITIIFISCKNDEPYKPSPNAPGKPTGLSAYLDGSNNTHLRWLDNSDNEDYFHLQRKQADEDWLDIGTAPEDSTYYIDSIGAVWETEFTYRVASANEHGRSYWSNEAGVVTPEAQCLIMIESDFEELKQDPDLIRSPRFWMCSDRYGYFKIMDMHQCDSQNLSNPDSSETMLLSGNEAGNINIIYKQKVENSIVFLNIEFKSEPSEERTVTSNHLLGFGFHNPDNGSWDKHYLENGIRKNKQYRATLPVVKYIVLAEESYYVRVEMNLENDSYSLWVNDLNLCSELPLDVILMVPSVHKVE